MLLNINPSSGVPLYRQIVEQVEWMVSAGQLTAGDELPSVREVARRHDINPMTVSKAYSLMETEGLVERQRGKPMRIRTRAASAEPLGRRLDRLEPEIRQLLTAARQLGIPDRDLVAAIRQHLEDLKNEPEHD